MSASREKKTRQDQEGQELTEKQRKAQQEAQKTRRNHIAYAVIGVVCAVGAAALLIWNSGFFQGRAAALEVGDETFTAADLEYYYRNVYNTYYTYAQYGKVSGLDYTQSPKDQTYDAETGETWHEFMLDLAVESAVQTKALLDLAEEEGYQLSQAGQDQIQETLESLENSAYGNNYSSVSSYLKTLYGRYMDQDKYERMITESILAQEFQDHYTDSLTYTDEELEDYYTENRDDLDEFVYHYAFFDGAAESTEDEEGNKVEPTQEEMDQALSAAQEKAEALRDALESGTSFVDASAEYEGDDTVNVYEENMVDGANLPTTRGYLDWMLEDGRQEGDVYLVQAPEDSTAEGYYVVQFVSRGRDMEHSVDVRHILIAAEQDADADAPTDEQYELARQEAEDILEQWQSGEATEDSFAKLAEEYSADTSSAVNGGLISRVSSSSGDVETFADWALDPARQSGDTGIVQNTGSSIKGWHIMYFVSKNDENWKEEARDALSSDDTAAWLEEVTGSVTVNRLSGLDYVG